MSCHDCQHRKSGKSLFSCLEDPALDRLGEYQTSRSYAREETLFHEGEEAFGIYCLKRGLVKLETFSENGGVQLLRLARPGDPIGYRAFLGAHPHRYRATAATSVSVCVFQGHILRETIATQPDFANALISKLTRDLEYSEARWLGLLQKNSEQRVAEILLELEEDEGGWPPRKEMAHLVDITPETFSRVLTQFHNRGWISRSRRDLKILEREMLKEFVAGD